MRVPLDERSNISCSKLREIQRTDTKTLSIGSLPDESQPTFRPYALESVSFYQEKTAIIVPRAVAQDFEGQSVYRASHPSGAAFSIADIRWPAHRRAAIALSVLVQEPLDNSLVQITDLAAGPLEGLAEHSNCSHVFVNRRRRIALLSD